MRLILGDALQILPTLAAGSVDAIITDLPYGTTACAWDEVIPFAPMWEQVKRLLRPRGVFVTTASQPFTSALVMSNLEWFRYAWVWEKTHAKGYLNSAVRPLMATEDICVFAAGLHTYNPQGLRRGLFNNSRPAKATKVMGQSVYGNERLFGFSEHTNYPRNLLKIPNGNNDSCHPTQKPVALYSYLIRTYTNPSDTVLDFVMGSGTTGVAAIKEGRNFVGCDNDAGYFAIATRRIEQAQMQLPLLELA